MSPSRRRRKIRNEGTATSELPPTKTFSSQSVRRRSCLRRAAVTVTELFAFWKDNKKLKVKCLNKVKKWWKLAREQEDGDKRDRSHIKHLTYIPNPTVHIFISIWNQVWKSFVKLEEFRTTSSTWIHNRSSDVFPRMTANGDEQGMIWRFLSSLFFPKSVSSLHVIKRQLSGRLFPLYGIRFPLMWC